MYIFIFLTLILPLEQNSSCAQMTDPYTVTTVDGFKYPSTDNGLRSYSICFRGKTRSSEVSDDLAVTINNQQLYFHNPITKESSLQTLRQPLPARPIFIARGAEQDIVLLYQDSQNEVDGVYVYSNPSENEHIPSLAPTNWIEQAKHNYHEFIKTSTIITEDNREITITESKRGIIIRNPHLHDDSITLEDVVANPEELCQIAIGATAIATLSKKGIINYIHPTPSTLNRLSALE